MKITLAYHQTSDEKRATVTRVRTRTTTERTTGENSTQNDEEEEDEAKAAQGEGACAVGMGARGLSCTAQRSRHCTFEARRRLKGRSLTGSSLRNGVASGEGGMHDDADAGLGTVDAVSARDRQAQRRRSCSVGLGLLQVRR